ncbi:hypothetical protein [Streptomyces canus]|uniref:hypothetical protein n=1 Tax=Streptomyces canus TaxID=58343 RepID=UPI002E2A1E51|nr:hypothetical protein [Streptomyces canus]
MASSELRLKLQRRREEEQASTISESLSGVRSFGYVQGDEMPDWVRRKVAEWLRSESLPDSRIDDEVEGQVNQWIEKFANDSRIGNRFYCRTGLFFFPWLDCEVTGGGWVRGLRAAIGNDLVMVSRDKSLLVAFFQEEYEYLAFYGSR